MFASEVYERIICNKKQCSGWILHRISAKASFFKNKLLCRPRNVELRTGISNECKNISIKWIFSGVVGSFKWDVVLASIYR